VSALRPEADVSAPRGVALPWSQIHTARDRLSKFFNSIGCSGPWTPMEKSANETVIVVHGTWAAPDPAERKWYQPIDERPCGEPFIARLDAALQARGSSARCWAHCGPGNPAFHWSGENNWIDRTLAAAALADYVAKLRGEGWHCHIVAHSHGGNVLVEALPHLATTLDSEKPQRNAIFVMPSAARLGSASSLRQLARRRSRIDCATVRFVAAR